MAVSSADWFPNGRSEHDMSTESSPSSASHGPQSRRSELPARQISEPEPIRERGANRRSFLVGAGVGALGAGLLADVSLASAQAGRGLTNGDEAILRFLSAAEILETDFWQQYNELGGIQDSEVPGGSGSETSKMRMLGRLVSPACASTIARLSAK